MANVSWKANETQTKFMEVLGNADKALTLAEASAIAGVEFKTGSINVLGTKGLVKSNPNAREIVCACCGHKRKVATYELVK